MIAHGRTCSVLAVSLVFLLGASAQGQGGHELRCRGRGGAFAIDKIDSNTASLRFTAGTRAAGAAGAGLDPGTCSFVDRAVETVEPLQIHFSANGAQLASVTRELNDPYTYWCFFVASGAKAFFMAAEQRACTCGENPVSDEKSRAAGSSSANSSSGSNSPEGTAAAGNDKTVKDDKALKDVVDPRPPVITEVSAVPSAKDIAFAFKSFANVTPHVEVATVPPVQGPDKRWSFPDFRPANKIEQTFLGTGPTIPLSSGIVKLIAGGNKSLGRYTANLMGALDPGVVYYYIISVRLNDDPASEIRQMKGIIHSPGSNKYEVRYRGLYSDSTGGTRSRDIYAIVSTSFVFPTGDPAILSAVPSALVPGVRGTEARADSGKRVYDGAPADLLMTVTLMQRVGGDPNKVKAAVHESFLNAVGRLLVSPTKPAGAVQLVTNSIKDAMIGGDSVIATSSRLVTAAEMKAMANTEAPKPTERGITYNFFTEYAGPGGAYRVYFEVVSR